MTALSCGTGGPASKASLGRPRRSVIERRPVAAEEVQLPRALLTLDWWDRKDSASATAAEHETVMELSEERILPDGSKPASPTVRTTRRRWPVAIQGSDREARSGGSRFPMILIRMRLTYRDASGATCEASSRSARPDPERREAGARITQQSLRACSRGPLRYRPRRKLPLVRHDSRNARRQHECVFHEMTASCSRNEHRSRRLPGARMDRNALCRGAQSPSTKSSRRPNCSQPRTWGID